MDASTYWTLAACVATGVLGAWIALRWRRLVERQAAQARSARGQRGEARAATLLEQHGYQIVDRQRRLSYAVRVGASEQRVQLVLDFVVRRDGREQVAEVKTGPNATQLTHEPTRRQLLEYQLARGDESVLLVDPERGTIETVSFPIPRGAAAPTAPQAALAPWLWAAIATALACWAWWQRQ